jgi:V8-like Glu-specific endopeptidase
VRNMRPAALAWAALAAVTVAGCTPAPRPAAAPSPVRASVGELIPAGSSSPSCVASVVRSTPGNVVLTAAHCLVGGGSGLQFVPGYITGARPFGTWTVMHAYVDPRWRQARDPAHDYAFLVLAPQVVNGHLENVQTVTGANRLAFTPPVSVQVATTAYVSGRQVSCTAPTYRTAGYPSFDCDGYPNGTSGSPWLLAPTPAPGTGDATVVGLIGGLHQGGCTPSTSYSPPFDAATTAVLARASAGAPADVLPAPGVDGC